ncbi:MAG: hypothetical protein VX197_00720, partial [Pseudomonadota bacterium]|nr:hypothetical protein [Pseudomonadota bacterium]
FINYYLLVHVVAMIIYAVIMVFGLAAQSISAIAIYLLPGFFLYTVLIWLVGFAPTKPKDVFF